MKESQTGKSFRLINKIYRPHEISKLLFKDWDTVKSQKGIEYYNIPATLDFETTSFYDASGNKSSIMYLWILGFNGRCIIGRTWQSLLDCYNYMVEALEINKSKRIVIYSHNLGMEFQYLQYRLKWIDVFALKNRTPLKAITAEYVEFKCSYLLSGYSLAKVGENLVKYPVRKMVGDLDYSLLRHEKTPMTKKELKYALNDGLVVMSFIQEKIETDGNILKIPLTNTGYVRREVKRYCLYGSPDHKKEKWKYVRYHNLMKSLTLEKSELEQLMRAFQGGFTHASCMYSGKVLKDVGSIDFTSSYPYVILSEKFPMSSGEVYKPTSISDFERQLKLYCCLFDIKIEGLCAKNFVDHPLSKSRCWDSKNVQTDNGRVVKADTICTTWTEQDYIINKNFYTWDKIYISNFRRYRKGYLPTDLVKAVLKFYSDKTTLKDVAGKEIEYLHSKGMLNSVYGMMVTAIIRDEIIFNDGWKQPKPCNIEDELTKYNEAKGRFLYYPWGVWVTAYARKNLFSGIYEMDNDYLYADTDSLKCINMKNHVDWIHKYNKHVEEKLKKSMTYHKIDYQECAPKTIKGKEKLIGVWDNEGNEDYVAYSEFKALRAKAYMYKYASGTHNAGKYNLTVSGINKKSAIPYILKNSDNPFEYFKNDMYIPPECTGKMTHTYIDDIREGVLVDYTGKACEYHELSGVHLESCDYNLSLTDEYINYLLGIGEEDMCR